MLSEMSLACPTVRTDRISSPTPHLRESLWATRASSQAKNAAAAYLLAAKVPRRKFLNELN